MAKPTISSIRPNVGHTGGRTMIEIVGSGFRMPDDAPAVPRFPEPDPRATVRVLFGDVEAEDVGIAEDGLLYATLPIHDPGAVSVTVENLAAAQAQVTSLAWPFVVPDGSTLEVSVGGGPAQIVTFVGVSNLPTLFRQLNDQLDGVQALGSGLLTVIRSDARGDAATLQILGGTANAVLGFPTTLARGSDATRVPIPGESVTVDNAFTFKRPDLGQKSHLTLVLEQLIVELQRQIHPNVHYSTDTDFDPDTGDLLNTTILASVPALVLTALELPVSAMHRQSAPVEIETTANPDGSPGAFIAKAPPDVRDAELVLVGVAHQGPETLNLFSAVARFFKKNGRLRVLRDAATPSLGSVEYELESTPGGPAQVSVQGQNTNLGSFQLGVAIRGILIEDILLEGEGTSPEDAPNGQPQEGTIEIGKTMDTFELGTFPR